MACEPKHRIACGVVRPRVGVPTNTGFFFFRVACGRPITPIDASSYSSFPYFQYGPYYTRVRDP